MKNVVYYTLLLFVGVPLFMLYGVLLQIKRRRFHKQMRTKIKSLSFSNAENYVHFKKYLHDLESVLPLMNRIDDKDVASAPYLLRYTLRQMKAMATTLDTYHKWLNDSLDKMNKPQPDSKVFRMVSEKELWDNRNKAYKYWM